VSAVQFLLRHRAPSYVLPCPTMTAINDVVTTRKMVVKENFARLADLTSELQSPLMICCIYFSESLFV